jgi:hypothetical protein
VPGDLHEHAPEDGTEHQTDCRDHRVGAHRQSELLLRKSVRYQCGGVGKEERRTYPLQYPPADQLGRAGREARAEGGQGKHEKAGHVRLLAPEQVAQASCHQDEHGGGDQVGEDHPYQREQARVQGPLEARQGDDQGA